jgi:uncharacterized membrane protein
MEGEAGNIRLPPSNFTFEEKHPMSEENITATHSPATPNSHLSPAPQSGDTRLAVTYLSCGLTALLGPHKDEPTRRFHGFQALFTVAAMLVLHAVLGILGGQFLLLLQPLTDLGSIGFGLFQVYRAYQGRPILVPFISLIARKQAAPDTGPSSSPQ